MGVDGSELLGLATYAAIAAARAAATNQAAKAEGITYEEMRLRENAARYRAGSNSRWTARGRCKRLVMNNLLDLKKQGLKK